MVADVTGWTQVVGYLAGSPRLGHRPGWPWIKGRKAEGTPLGAMLSATASPEVEAVILFPAFIQGCRGWAQPISGLGLRSFSPPSSLVDAGDQPSGSMADAAELPCWQVEAVIYYHAFIIEQSNLSLDRVEDPDIPTPWEVVHCLRQGLTLGRRKIALPQLHQFWQLSQEAWVLRVGSPLPSTMACLGLTTLWCLDLGQTSSGWPASCGWLLPPRARLEIGMPVAGWWWLG